MGNITKVIARAGRQRRAFVQLNDFTDACIPDALGTLREVTHLHISGCPNLVGLPAAIKNLTKLEKLTIVNSGLETLPDEVGECAALREITILGSALQGLPDALTRLRNLQSLTLRASPLRSLPQRIGDLISLGEISIAGARMRELPESITDLKYLHKIELLGGWLGRLPSTLGSLSSLQTLVLRGNFLTELPLSIGALRELRHLDVEHNRLVTIPETMRDLVSLEALRIDGTTGLAIPPEILKGTPQGILDFFFRSSRRRRLNEAKILLVGQGGVGKTSLVKRLLDDQFDEREAKTDGINIRSWSTQGAQVIKMNVWDFGGQEIMHSTHQFFLTKRSLYILVLDARAGERESNIHYWLEMISLYGADSPVLVVLNKSEDHFDQLDETRLRLDYAGAVQFAGFFNISCKTRLGLTELRDQIEKLVRSMPHVSDQLPEDYFLVKAELEAKSATKDFITQPEYEAACRKHNVSNVDEQRRLLRFLHDLGSVLHYDDPEQKYNVYDTRVLNPEWVTSGVYKILNDPVLLRDGAGIMHKSDLSRMLDPARYPQHRYPFLIDIMRKYELCIEFPDHPGRLLVPELLSKNEPDVGWSRTPEALNFEYHYGVLPRGLVPRFIVRTQHLLSSQATVWRSGAVLQAEDCRVLVRGDLRRSKVFIQVQGEKANRRRALAVVRDTFSSVHAGYGDLNAEAKIPLPRDPTAPPVDYRHLIKLEREGVEQTFFEKASQPYSVRELLAPVALQLPWL